MDCGTDEKLLILTFSDGLLIVVLWSFKITQEDCMNITIKDKAARSYGDSMYIFVNCNLWLLMHKEMGN
jgi:hypothetical protein